MSSGSTASPGTRGGARIIYLYVPRWEHVHLLVIYGKDEADDLTPAERKVVRLQIEAVLQEYAGRKPNEEGAIR